MKTIQRYFVSAILISLGELLMFNLALETLYCQTHDSNTQIMKLPQPGKPLDLQQSIMFAELALKNIQTEYPNKPSNVLADESGLRTPRQMHPAFYGCFDWHSAVHGHWMLVRLLKDYPDSPINSQIRQKLSENLTAENLQGELAFFEEHEHRAYERMYGWAWYFRLVAELDDWDDLQGKQWRQNLKGLEQLLVQRTIDYLPRLTWPIRTGIHPDTGFALGQSLDYARQVGNQELKELIIQRSKDFYSADTNYPVQYEPSGQDFFSSGLNEADLMRRVLPQASFVQWLEGFLPHLGRGDRREFQPAQVSDVTDGYLVHLAGLNFNRAWCLQGIASALPADDPRIPVLTELASAHAAAGLEYVFSGHYEGEHWLATFAIYYQAGVGNQASGR